MQLKARWVRPMWPPQAPPRFSSLILQGSLGPYHPPGVQVRGLGCSPPTPAPVPLPVLCPPCFRLIQNRTRPTSQTVILPCWPHGHQRTHQLTLWSLAQSPQLPQSLSTCKGHFNAPAGLVHCPQLCSHTLISVPQRGRFTDVIKFRVSRL